MVEFDYIYETDEIGRLKEWKASELQLTSRESRLKHNPHTPGKQVGDHASHIAADRFGDSPEVDNIVSQLSGVNLSDYKKIENQWASALKNNLDVSTNVTIIYEGAYLRPSAFNVEFTIDGEFFSQIIPNN